MAALYSVRPLSGLLTRALGEIRPSNADPAAADGSMRPGGGAWPADGGVRQRRSPAMAKSATRAPNSTGRAPGGGGEVGEAY
jgi:hypothetical protein